MFKSTRKSRRLRNKQHHEDNKKPFFSKEEKGPVVPARALPFFQRKLAIGQPGDAYEREADAVADSVVNHSATQPVVQRQEISSIQRTTLATPIEDEKLGTAEGRLEKDKLIQEKPEIQRMGEQEEEPVQMQEASEEESVQMMGKQEEEDPVQMQSEEEEPVQMQEASEEEPVQMMGEQEEEPVQTKEEEEPIQKAGNRDVVLGRNKIKGQSVAPAELSNKIKSKAGKGRKLPRRILSSIESSMGMDFSHVNIHTDSEAVGLNQTLGAQAFTHGNDIYFNQGKYKPETTEGKRLLVHELVHTVQQKGKKSKRIQRAAAAGVLVPVAVSSGPIGWLALGLVLAIVAAIGYVAYEKRRAYCQGGLNNCVGRFQPDRGYGKKMDCGACFRECMLSGSWPYYKCAI